MQAALWPNRSNPLSRYRVSGYLLSGIAGHCAMYLPPKFALSQPRGGGGRGYCSSIYTEQMDAEGLGRKLLLTPPPPLKSRLWALSLWISHNAHPPSTFEFSQCRHCKERLPGPRKGFWVTSGNLSPKTAASIYTL